MLNKEKYGKELVELAISEKHIAVKNGVPVECTSTFCAECDISSPNECCAEALNKWANSEYTKPEVDWSKVQVDTPVLVSMADDDSCAWNHRHFSHYDGKNVWVFRDGTTSWTAYGGDASPWPYTKLAEEAEN